MSRRKRERNRRDDEQRERMSRDPDVVYVTTVDDQLEALKARSENQKKFIQDIRKSDLTICTGPAGCGKTFLSVALALQALRDGNISKIILTRPVVEAGEKLGFLPGDLQEKINPYLRPLYDSLNYLLGPDQYKRLISEEIIEIAPLAYMRGRTLENSFIILDEAQNTTVEQIIMLVTRLGQGSKMVVNGDVTQIDLPKNKESGLVELSHIVGHLPSITFHQFTDADVVRHPIVKEIVVAYEQWKSKKQNGHA